ncbi:LXG domain-containing protein [Terribacillus saccharophilus]|uniref:ribonuclease YeeF family protein n=1 Tax=Terribacillus saccharophilus TaxID=361277 RepID=UPI00398226D5
MLKEFSVKEIHKGTETSKLDLDTLSEQLSNLQQKVRNLYSLEDALKGKTGTAIRSFYNEIHTPFITFLLQSMEDYKNRLEDMKNDVESFEPSHHGYISESFLNNELHPGLDQAKSKVASVSESINSVLSGVANITYVAKISYSDFESSIEDGKKQLDDVMEDLGELDSKHASKLQETQSDLDTMKKYLSEMTTGLSNGSISIGEFDAASLQNIDAYNNVIQQSYGNGNVEITEENVEYLPMSAIAAATKRAEEGMDEGISVLVSHAQKDLREGNISRKEYYGILSMAKGEKALTEASDKERTDNFIDYTNKNWDKITQDVSKEVFATSIEQIGVQTQKIGEFTRDLLYLNANLGLVGSRTAQHQLNQSNKWINTGSKLMKGGAMLGKVGIPAISAVYGTYEDMNKNDKTFGEAVAKNAAATGVGTLVTLGTTALVSNPGGWAILGGMAVAVGFSHGFNWLYDNNIGGIQDGLDAVGEKIDDAGKAIVNQAEKTVDSFKEIGEGIKDGIASLRNPMTYARWMY